MRSDFPVPRSLLPRLHVTPKEHAARKAQMDRMLRNALDEYDRFRTLDHSRIDLARWKLSASKDSLRLYRERKVGSSGYKATSSSFSMSDDDTKSQDGDGYWEDLAYDPTKVNDRHKVKSMRMFGDMPGQVEDAVFAVLATSNTELALVHTFLHDDAADSRLLHVLEGPTPDRPLHSLAYKWFVKRAPGGGRIIKHRDVLSLEYTGMTTTRKGERIGFLLIESVDLPGFPDMKDRNCLRAVQSVCALLRQKRDGLVEVCMTGVVELSGNFIRPLSSMLTAQSMFIVTKVMDLAMCKRLTKLLVRQRRARRDRLNNNEKSVACEICQQRPRFFNGVRLVPCGICGQTICTQCQTPKRLFIADGKLGHYERVGCCKPCVSTARRTHTSALERRPIKIAHSTPQRQSSSRDFDTTRSPSVVSRSRSSSAESFHHESPHLPPTIDEEGFLLLPVDAGIKLLPTYAVGLSRDAVQAQPEVYVDPQLQRNCTGSSGSHTYAFQTAGADLVVRPASAVPTFPASAPGGTYNFGAPPPSLRRTPSEGTTQQDLYARMMELRLVAESSYYTAQQNRAKMRPLSLVDLE